MTLPRSAIVTSAGVGVLLLLSGCASNGADSAGVATPTEAPLMNAEAVRDRSIELQEIVYPHIPESVIDSRSESLPKIGDLQNTLLTCRPMFPGGRWKGMMNLSTTTGDLLYL